MNVLERMELVRGALNACAADALHDVQLKHRDLLDQGILAGLSDARFVAAVNTLFSDVVSASEVTGAGQAVPMDGVGTPGWHELLRSPREGMTASQLERLSLAASNVYTPLMRGMSVIGALLHRCGEKEPEPLDAEELCGLGWMMIELPALAERLSGISEDALLSAKNLSHGLSYYGEAIPHAPSKAA